MTDREIMQMALEALEAVRPYIGAVPKKADKAITALRLAIEQAERQEFKWYDEEEGWFYDPADSRPSDAIPLYTSPPQRQPLTKHELHLALDKAGIKANGVTLDHEFAVARVVEREHGIGGDA